MSTRCQVRIVDNGYPLNIYNHSDGDFGGVGQELQGFLKEQESNGNFSAWNLAENLFHICNGYEPTFGMHRDIEYFYLLDFDKHEFHACKVRFLNVWPREGDDDYDQYQPCYNQLPRIEEKVDMLTTQL